MKNKLNVDPHKSLAKKSIRKENYQYDKNDNTHERSVWTNGPQHLLMNTWLIITSNQPKGVGM